MWIRALRACACVATALIIVACDRESQRSKDKYEFVELIRLEGLCSEKHVRQEAKYRGDLVHWHNITKDRHMQYGSVHHWEEAAATVQRFESPHTYFPPFTIEFSELTQDEIKGDTLTLSGISEHLGSGERRGPSYEASCRFKVVERLNYLPSQRQIKRQ
jgi:hypothetical protein